MTFTTPLWLLLLGLLPLIVILHAMAVHWRRATVSSLMFWADALRDRRTSVRLNRILSNAALLCELATVAALALALAGPRVATRGLGPGGDTILVLDVTASMQTREGGRTRFDEARARGLELVAGLRRDARMAVILAGRTPRLAAGFTADRTSLRRLIRGASATDEPGDIGAAMALAVSLRDPWRADQIALVTDGAFESLGGVDPGLPFLHFFLVGTPKDNAGITALAFRRQVSSGAAGYELFVAVANNGARPRAIPLTVSANGRVVVSRTLEVGAHGRATVSLPWPGRPEGRAEARISPNDDFPVDDVAYAVVAPARRLRVLVVGLDTYFIQKALDALPGITVQALPVPLEPLPPSDLSVFVGVAPPPTETGNEIVFGAAPPNLPLTVAGSVDRPPVTGFMRRDPLLASVSLTGITIGSALRMEPGPGFTVHASSGDLPLVLSWDAGGLRAIVAAFDPQHSDLPLCPDFLILMANALEWFFPSWLAVTADEVQAGDAIPLDAAERAAVVTRPDGSTVTLAASEAAGELVNTSTTGFYTVKDGRGTRDFAVSLLSDEESDVSPRFAAPGGARQSGSATSGSAPIWEGLAVAALALVILEWIAWLRPGRRASGAEREAPR